MRDPRGIKSFSDSTRKFRQAAGALRLLLLIVAAILSGSLFISTASAQWVAADLFPAAPAPVEPGPNGLEGLGGVIDPSPVLRGLGRLRLQLPGGSVVEMARDGFERRGDGGVTWRGRVTDDEGSRVILTVKDGYMAGRILRGLEEYRIIPGPGRSHIIERIDSSVAPVEEHVEPPVDYSYDIGPVYEPGGYAPNYGNSPDNIQLLVVYSLDALAAAGGEPQIEVRIQSMVDQLNTAFVDSGMIARVALVQALAADYSDSGDVRFDLDWLLTRHELINFEIDAQRKFYGADLVSMVVDNGGQCAGAAYVMHTPAYDFVSYAYSVTALNCGGAGLAHEIGHNMGFEHNPEDSIRYQTYQQTATPFSFGHYVDGSFRTIMSYATPCLSGCPMAYRFSNPNLDLLGFPTGIADQRDNAQTGDYTAPIVTDFMDAVTGAVVNRRVSASVEDVAELADGSVIVDGTTLELGDGLAGVQAVGLRFQNLNIPVGMRIDSAYLEFEAADVGSDSTSVQIHAEVADNATPFSTTPYDVTGRTATTASVQWDLPAWNTVTEKHYSPDISAVIQEVVDRPGWAENNSMVITVGGTGVRTALAHDGDAASAPLLHVEYAATDRPATISTPVAAFSYTCTDLTCSFTDESTDSDGVIIYWSWDFGGWSFSEEQHPTFTFPADGTYTVSLYVMDDQAWEDYTETQISVVVGNSSPVATDDAYTTSQDTPVSGNLLTDGTPDSDVDGDPLMVTSNTNPSNGTLAIAAEGAFTYTPAAGFTGDDSFTYTISDGNGGVATATVAITVTGSTNAAPVATDNAYVTDEDVAISGNVMLDGTPDNDPDGDPLTVTGNTSPLNGAVTMAANGDFTYTPDTDFSGSDSFTYTIGDGNGKTATATVTVTVNPVNDAPVATDDTYVTDEDVVLTGNVIIDGTPDSDVDGDILTITANTNPVNGTLTIAANGDFTYAPAAEFSGSDGFTYTVSDGALTATATVDITVNWVNDPPVATDNAYVTDKDVPVSGNVLTDGVPDSDVEGDVVTVSDITKRPAYGMVSLALTTGVFTYTPPPGFVGTDDFEYTATDGNGISAPATVTITVNPVNDPPVAAFSYSCAALACDFTDASTDADGTIVSWAWDFGDGAVSSLQNPAHSYAAPGTYSVTLTVSDSDGAIATETQSIALSNADPVATDDAYTAAEDAPVSGNLLLDGTPDSDADGDPLTVTANTDPINGTVTVAANGTFTYTPDPDFNGSDSFTYTIGDGVGGTATAMVAITVTPVNDAPAANDDTYITGEDIQRTGNVLTDGTPDSDVDGDSLTVIANTEPLNGTLTIAVDGAFIYMPAAEYSGADSFTYTVSDGAGGSDTATVSITVNPLNDPPVATENVYFTTEDTPVSGNVLTDGTPDSDIEGDTLTVTANTESYYGTVIVAANGAFTFTPAPNFVGATSFTYTVGDGNGGSATASVWVNVSAVNDPPVAAFGHSCSGLTCSFADGSSDPLDSGGSIASWSWTFGDGAVSSEQNPSHSYAADGTYTVTLTVADNEGDSDTATQSVIVANTAPVATDNSYSFDEDTVLYGNLLTDGVADSDPDGDSLILVSMTNLTEPGDAVTVWDANGDFYIRPNTNVNGVYDFTYTISDGNGGSATAAVTVTINPVNDAPVAVDDSYTIPEGDTLIGNAIGVSDTDVDGDTLTVTANTDPSNGTLTMAADGIFTYIPNANFNGTDSFTYTIGDGAGGSDTATVTITVVPVNDAPVAADNAYATDEDVAVSGNVLTDGTPDMDPDGDPLTVTATTNPSNGTLTMSANGAFSYTPAANYNGTDSFAYTIGDGAGGGDTATVTVTVNSVNDAPVATDNAYSTAKNTAVTGNVLFDGVPDGDVDGDSLTAELNGSPASGTVSLSADGSFTYTPDNGFSGSDSFGYMAHDGNGGSAAATVTITVTKACQGIKCKLQSFFDWRLDTGSTRPAAPSDLTGSATTVGVGPDAAKSVTLRWSDNSNNEDAFVIERCNFFVDGNFASCKYLPAGEVAADITSYTETVAGGGYMYRVKARNAQANSTYSNVVWITDWGMLSGF